MFGGLYGIVGRQGCFVTRDEESCRSCRRGDSIATVTTYLHNSLCFVSDTLAGLRATDTTVDLPVTLHLGRSEGQKTA